MAEDEKNEQVESNQEAAKNEQAEETGQENEVKSEQQQEAKSEKQEASSEQQAEPQPEPEPKADYVSREEYESLKSDLSSLTKARAEEVVQRRVDEAIAENFIDEKDDDAVEQVREIAKNDASWTSYKKIASPKTPDHISARRFQEKNLKSNKHTGDSKMLDTVLEHQQA